MLATLLAMAAAAPAKDYSALFSAWKAQHAKSYAGGDAEVKAFKAFAYLEDYITTHNATGLSYTLGHNEFSDLTADEFFATRLGYAGQRQRPAGKRLHVTTPESLARALEDDVDWRANGAVTPIKNQGQCGSCWSFSTTGAVEGAYVAMSGGNLTSLSEEDLVQCDQVDSGCEGGLMDNAFEYVEKNGLAAEADYPYISGTGIRGMCDTAKQAAAVVTITGYHDVPEGNETALLSAVSQQPVAIAIEADKSAFQSYKSGVLDSPFCGKQLDHGVLLVGYGTQKGALGSKDCAEPSLDLTPSGSTRCLASPALPLTQRSIETRLHRLDRQEQLGRDLGRGRLHPHGARQEHVRRRAAGLVPDRRQEGVSEVGEGREDKAKARFFTRRVHTEWSGRVVACVRL